MKIEKPLSRTQNQTVNDLISRSRELSEDSFIAGQELQNVLKTAQHVAILELRTANPLRLRKIDVPNATLSEYDAQCLLDAVAILKRIRKQAERAEKALNRIPENA